MKRADFWQPSTIVSNIKVPGLSTEPTSFELSTDAFQASNGGMIASKKIATVKNMRVLPPLSSSLPVLVSATAGSFPHPIQLFRAH